MNVHRNKKYMSGLVCPAVMVATVQLLLWTTQTGCSPSARCQGKSWMNSNPSEENQNQHNDYVFPNLLLRPVLTTVLEGNSNNGSTGSSFECRNMPDLIPKFIINPDSAAYNENEVVFPLDRFVKSIYSEDLSVQRFVAQEKTPKNKIPAMYINISILSDAINSRSSIPLIMADPTLLAAITEKKEKNSSDQVTFFMLSHSTHTKGTHASFQSLPNDTDDNLAKKLNLGNSKLDSTKDIPLIAINTKLLIELIRSNKNTGYKKYALHLKKSEHLSLIEINQPRALKTSRCVLMINDTLLTKLIETEKLGIGSTRDSGKVDYWAYTIESKKRRKKKQVNLAS